MGKPGWCTEQEVLALIFEVLDAADEKRTEGRAFMECPAEDPTLEAKRARMQAACDRLYGLRARAVPPPPDPTLAEHSRHVEAELDRAFPGRRNPEARHDD